MEDFGGLVGRYSTATPTLSVDDSLRELRLDAGGRLYVRTADDRDKAIRYFYDGESIDGGDITLDRGILILGKNDTDSNYQALRVADDGSLVVGFDAGSDISEAADKANASDGEVALGAQNAWVQVQKIAVIDGKVHVDGYSYASDKNALFQLVLADGTANDRTDVSEILDTQVTTSFRPSDHIVFQRALSRAGGANVYVAIFAKRLQSGSTNGVALTSINAHKTT